MISSRKRFLKRMARALRWCSTCLLLLGAAGVAWYGFARADTRAYQAYQSWRFDHLAMKQSAPVAETSADSLVKSRTLAASPESVAWRIKIPRVGVSAMVLEGDDASTLRRGVGHIPGTALPGQPGNVGIAGHRDTFFRPLKDVRKNDLIILETLGGTYRYRVESYETVRPDDIQVLEGSNQPTLILVTCYPFYFVGAAPNRFIVRARAVPE